LRQPQAGGRAEVSSKEGKGTTVSILLPATDKEAPDAVEESEATEFPKGLSVLLVEDNEQVRQFAEDLLRDLGCEVIAAADGKEALELLDTQPVDLLFSDVVMPGISGIELARQARQLKPGLPVLLATGYSDEVVKNSPEFEVVPKPYRPQQLGKAIAAVLSRHGERAA
jgi:CheY-like chemotaxis protein